MKIRLHWILKSVYNDNNQKFPPRWGGKQNGCAPFLCWWTHHIKMSHLRKCVIQKSIAWQQGGGPRQNAQHQGTNWKNTNWKVRYLSSYLPVPWYKPNCLFCSAFAPFLGRCKPLVLPHFVLSAPLAMPRDLTLHRDTQMRPDGLQNPF